MAYLTTVVDPIVGQPDSSEEAKIPADLDKIVNFVNGNIGASNLLPAFLNTHLITTDPPSSGYVWGVDFGLAMVGGPAPGGGANSIYSELHTVNHNLGVMPQYIFATAASGAAFIGVPGVQGTYPYSASTGSPTSSTFSLQGKLIQGGYETNATWGQTGPNPLPVFWVAIGPIPAPAS